MMVVQTVGTMAVVKGQPKAGMRVAMTVDMKGVSKAVMTAERRVARTVGGAVDLRAAMLASMMAVYWAAAMVVVLGRPSAGR
jgi:hypothetical protein